MMHNALIMQKHNFFTGTLGSPQSFSYPRQSKDVGQKTSKGNSRYFTKWTIDLCADENLSKKLIFSLA